MTEIIPIFKVFSTVRVYDEIQLLKDPLYRDERWLDVHNRSMAKHRDYVRRMLSYYREIDEVQTWLICLLSALYRRLESNVMISKGSAESIIKSAWPPTLDESLQAYRENLIKLMV